MSTLSTHTSLLARVRDSGDADAWRDLERRYGPLVIGYCLRRGMQITDAEDIRQAVMLSLSRAMPGFEYQPAKGRFRDYLGSVVRHAVIRHRSKPAERFRPVGLDWAEASHASTECEPDAEWERQWVRRHCQLAMEFLKQSEDARNIEVFDRLLKGQTAQQAAEAMGLTAEAVRKIKQRVRERLETYLTARMREEEEPFGRVARES